MKSYRILIDADALNDLEQLSHIIKNKYKSPLTAVRYLRELKIQINNLRESAHMYQVQYHRVFRQYGIHVRRINYKKMTVIYTLHDDTVIIHRIISQSHIAEL